MLAPDPVHLILRLALSRRPRLMDFAAGEMAGLKTLGEVRGGGLWKLFSSVADSSGPSSSNLGIISVIDGRILVPDPVDLMIAALPRWIWID